MSCGHSVGMTLENDALCCHSSAKQLRMKVDQLVLLQRTKLRVTLCSSLKELYNMRNMYCNGFCLYYRLVHMKIELYNVLQYLKLHFTFENGKPIVNENEGLW